MLKQIVIIAVLKSNWTFEISEMASSIKITWIFATLHHLGHVLHYFRG